MIFSMDLSGIPKIMLSFGIDLRVHNKKINWSSKLSGLRLLYCFAFGVWALNLSIVLTVLTCFKIYTAIM